MYRGPCHDHLAAGLIIVSSHHFSQSEKLATIGDLNCSGGESHVLDCVIDSDTTVCSPYNNAALQCIGRLK